MSNKASEPQRYECKTTLRWPYGVACGEVRAAADGPYILHNDYARDLSAAQQQIAELERDCLRLSEPARFRREEHTIGKTNQWLVLALRMLRQMDREDVAAGLEADFERMGGHP